MTKEQFKNLFDAHFDDIRRYLYYRSGDTALATDLAQDTFMRVWEKNLILEPEKDSGLLFKIASDLFVSHLRRDRISREYMKELKFDFSFNSADEEVQYKELKDRYENALVKLPENHRIVFLMSRIDGLTYREIANRLNLSVKAIEKRMTGALSRLKQELKP